jgi:hypothetical protein
MVVFGAFAQGVTLPVITAATIYLRFRRTDRRLAPSLFTDGCLWLAFFAISGGAIYSVRSTVVEHWTNGGRGPKAEKVGSPPARDSVISAAIGRLSLRERTPFRPAKDGALETACREIASDLGRRLGRPSAAIVRVPFVVAGNLSEDELNRWHESTIGPAARDLARRYFATAPDEPITVLLFSDRAAYERRAASLFGDTRVSRYGYYKPHLRTLLTHVGANTGAGALVHELTHALMDFDFPGAPDWFDEGLAALHEGCRMRRDESDVDAGGGLRVDSGGGLRVDSGGGLRVDSGGGLRVDSGGGLRVEFVVNWRLAGLQRTIRKGRLRSLEALILDDDFRGPEIGLNYAHARYFCMYLQSDQNPRRRDVLADLYRELRAGRHDDPQGARAVRRIFPECSWRQLDVAFRDFVLSLDW